jgi:predicted membrane protein
MENEVKNSFRSGYTKGMGVGLVLMVIGVIFLAANFGFVSDRLRNILISWQMLLIVIGVVNLFRQKLIPALWLIFIGGFFLIPKVVEGIDGNFIHVYWPLLLIAAGVMILMQRFVGPRWGNDWWKNDYHHHHHHHHYRSNRYDQSKWTENMNNPGFSKNSVFGSGDHIVLDPEFKGGELNAVFGGITLDLRRTNLPVGETLLDINAVFGGITIYVPVDWFVETHLDAVFGGFQDNRLPKEPTDTTRKLIITGSCVFGGGELRN